ncbi:hypothetical protein [Clostridium estertheticum]|uniref:Viral A-type inclusion protein n=1 Tax=Clostridium estertheticum TaxID=238834 RepID=A0A7Y3STU0_9CLOT|nr:hypothetical protein [Clostridium estertheticum]MCB2353721.1 hypothetical protein [Clostridium estertheticum]NNU75249.1 hypothetical protein [Clostridium estertheticum]WAG40571.1 hypothetical protein LL065_20335 [Clostridium estertheticum]WBL48281.1 hypothetical protein LOR37_06375 [Clostridium estertheticum]
MNISSSLNTSPASKDNIVKTEKSNNIKKSRNLSLGGTINKNKILDQLIKQKQNLTDSKNALVDRALKSGESISSIKDKLENIDSQIKKIDAQISKIQMEDQRKLLDTDKKSNETKKAREKSKTHSSNNTKTDVVCDQMDSLLNLSGNLAKIQVLSSEKKSMMGETKVLESEIKLDISRGLNPIAKKEQVAKLTDQMINVAENIGNNLNTINNGLKDIREKSTFNEAIDKNQQNKNNVNIKGEDKLSPQQQQIVKNIQYYNDNMPDNAIKDGQNVDATA